MTEHAFRTRSLSKRFRESRRRSITALDRLTLDVPAGRVVGLVGRNGSGKTTLLRHVVGLLLPDEGECETLGVPTARLGERELGRIGMAHQEGRLIEWMRVEQILRYVASFHERWDRSREELLVRELEIDRRARVGTLSPGGMQKVGLVLAVCPRPELLLLDEPASALDPIARERMLAFLLESLTDDGSTIVISSHVLRDVERIVDWIVCLDRGRLVASLALDDLLERYAEWEVQACNGRLPPRFEEGFVLRQEVERDLARLLVRDDEARRREFQRVHHVEVERRPLSLERIFPLLLAEAERAEVVA